jgi:hypothetical protein
MKKYKVTLARGYSVIIEAENEKSAKENVEFFLGDSPDKSNEKHRTEYKFNIEDIELTFNEALEAEEINE